MFSIDMTPVFSIRALIFVLNYENVLVLLCNCCSRNLLDDEQKHVGKSTKKNGYKPNRLFCCKEIFSQGT